MCNFRVVVGVFSCVLIILSPKSTAEAQGNSPSLSIVVMGRIGSGVASTVQELIGPLIQCPPLANLPPLHPKILEYTLHNITSSNGSEYSIKLVEVPELVDNPTLEQEAEILASLKAYLQDDDIPKIFLVLSSFDDEDFENEDSKFIQLLQRVQLFQQSFLSEERLLRTGTMFLLTNLMDARVLWQRRPRAKLEGFRVIIEEFTSFPLPIHISVGESRREKLGNLKKENGNYILPNREHFPKNVWENILSLVSGWNNSEVVQDAIITFMKDSRISNDIVCDLESAAKDWEFLKEDIQDFTYFLERNLNWSFVDTEINSEIDEVFSTFPQNLQQQGSLQKTALQIRLHELGIETVADLPTSPHEKMKLFDQISLGVGAIILKKQFGFQMPQYKYPLNVGFGYNLLKDESLTSSPFRKDFLLPSTLGYEFPGFVECTGMHGERQAFFAEIVDSYSNYVSERLKSLHLPANYLDRNEFTGNIMPGFSIQEDYKNSTTTTFSVLKEIRTVKCTILKSMLQVGIVTEEFRDAVDNLTKLDQSSRESVNTWRAFFTRFGSHIVSTTYGGGSLQVKIPINGSEELQKVKHQFNSWNQAGKKWQRESGMCSFKGGNLNSHVAHLSKLETGKLRKLLGSWETSLTHDFVMLNHELELKPISFVVGLFNETKGEIVSMAITRLLNGELKYAERKEGQNGGERWWSVAIDEDDEVDVDQVELEDDLLEDMHNVSSSRCGGLLDGPSGWINFSDVSLLAKVKPSSCVWTIHVNSHELIKLTTQLSASNNNSHPLQSAYVIETIHDLGNHRIIKTRLEENSPQIYIGPVIFVVLSQLHEFEGSFQLEYEGIGKRIVAMDTLFTYKSFEGSGPSGSLSGADLESVMQLNGTKSSRNYTSIVSVSTVFPNVSTNVQLVDMDETCSFGSSFLVLSHFEDNVPRLRDCCKSDRSKGNLLRNYKQSFLVLIKKNSEETMNFNLTWRARRDEIYSGIGTWKNVTVENNNCGGVVVGKEGQINYKLTQRYDDRERCLWLLHSPTSSKITLTLLQAGFEVCCDFIVVKTVDPASGSLGNDEFKITRENPTRTFGGSVVAILFRSDGSTTGNGFSLQFAGNGENIGPKYSYKMRHTSSNEITKYPDWDWEEDEGEGANEIILLASKLVPGFSEFSSLAWQTDISKFVGTSLSKSTSSCTYDTLNFYTAILSNLGYNLAHSYPLPEEQLSCTNKIDIPRMEDRLSNDIAGVLVIYKRVQDPVY